jgi:hypothetical protein
MSVPKSGKVGTTYQITCLKKSFENRNNDKISRLFKEEEKPVFTAEKT